MKHIIYQIFIGLTCIVTACSDDEEVMSQPDTNGTPSDFLTLTPNDGEEGVALLPTLTWTESIDPERNVIVYELYLDETTGDNLLASDFTKNSYTLLDSLKPETTYQWKVIATDGDSGRTQSNYSTFTTGVHGDWQELEPTSGLFPIRQHTSLVFDDNIWIIGGSSYDILEAGDNVYKSADGKSWEVVTESGFPQRSQHASVVFNGKMWIIGGSSDGFSEDLNDVWFSEDGITWINANATGLPNMMGHAAVVYDGKIWVMHQTGLYNSNNGTDWVKVESTTFPANIGAKSLVFDNKLWLIGGRDVLSGELVNDIWYTNDGIEWYQTNSPPSFPKRVLHSIAVFDGKMWVMGGLHDSLGALNDTWYSSDGEHWYEILTNESLYTKRFYHTSVVFNQGLLTVGGVTDLTWLSTDDALDDAWFFEKRAN